MSVSIGRGVSAEIPPKTIGLTVDGGGSAIVTGVKGYLLIPYIATIRSWHLTANASGSAVVDVWKTSYPSIPTSANSITGSDPPTLSGSISARNHSISGWSDLYINEDDMVGFNIVSVDGSLTKLTLLLRVE